MAEVWPVSVYPGRFRPDEGRMQVLARTAGLLGDLEAAIRRELGADRIPPKVQARDVSFLMARIVAGRAESFVK